MSAISGSTVTRARNPARLRWHSSARTGPRWVSLPTIWPSIAELIRSNATVGLSLSAIDQRPLQSFRYYMTGSPFEYEFVRKVYQVYREFLIES